MLLRTKNEIQAEARDHVDRAANALEYLLDGSDWTDELVAVRTALEELETLNEEMVEAEMMRGGGG
jgi:hypothetical protein